ncbi:hypothetical protein BDL97_06G012600 [Sphagnum fallax]|nr:hypothetical protein BDL97_06G012600 [Sphagnum fallax]
MSEREAVRPDSGMAALRHVFRCSSCCLRIAFLSVLGGLFFATLGAFSSPVQYAGFVESGTIHTLRIEGATDDCQSLCSLTLQHLCHEPGQWACSPNQRIRAKPLVAFRDLMAGNYLLTTNCTDTAEEACYADPQAFNFEVSMDLNTRTEVNLIHLGALKLVKSLPHSWKHSSQQIWRLRCSFVMVVCILVGVGLVMISNAEKKYAASLV